MFSHIFSHPVALLFLIIAIGSAIGQLKFANLTLGASAVLFVALVFGHFGVVLPKEIQQLGIILFVYSIGLQAGPRFFNQFKKRGIQFAQIGVAVVLGGAVLTWLMTRLFHIDPALAIGMYAGAMTSTPGLAAAMDASRNPLVGVGYGVAYPFGVIGLVILVQVLPRILRIDFTREDEKVRNSEQKSGMVCRKQFYVTNPAVEGKTLADLQLHRLIEANISRILRSGIVMPARPDTPFEIGDEVLAVGQESELNKLTLIFGAESDGDHMAEAMEVTHRNVFVSNEQMTGKSLAELGVLERWGVTITRVLRDEIEFVPTGRFVLEIGDSVRVAGPKELCEQFVAEAGQQEKRIHETSMLALAIGIFIGMWLGFHEFNLPGGVTFRLGLAGGPLFVSLIFAHYGRIGKLNIRTPRGAKYLLSQLGLVFFLAGAGTDAGGSFAKVIVESGASLLAAGAMITIGASAVGYLICRFVFKMDMLSTLGAICGGMTSTPALGAIADQTDSKLPLLSYSSVYPVALILITVVSQLLFFLL